MSEYGLQDDDKQIILDILKTYPQIEEVVLFGSRALNTFKSTSDVDLAIKGKGTNSILAALMADFEESDLIYEVDLVDYASINTEKLLEHIDRHGKVFYRKGWVDTTLGQHCLKIGSGATPRGGNEAYKQEGISLIRSQNVLDFDFSYKGLAFIDDEQASKLSNVEILAGDVLVNITGDSVARICSVPNEVLPARVNQHVAIVRTNEQELNSTFLRYYLLNPIFKRYLLILANSGGTRNALTKSMLEILEINLPPPLEQKSIANILSSFDEKIELLREQNKTLETLAQTIFKEWFVNFNYPDATGEMVDSELGEIPKGWRVKTIDELIELIIDYRGKTPKKLGMDWSDSGIPALSAKTIKDGKIVRRDAMNIGSKELYDIWMKDELAKKDILLTSEAPLGEMYYLPDGTKYILSQRLFALRANKDITPEYLYHYLFSPLGQYLLKSRASGSTVEGIRQSELRKIEVMLPEKGVMERASDIFVSVFEKTGLNDKQIQNLTNTRDSILPKLMSGEVRVQGVIR